jgi:protein SERAC1
VDSTCGLIFLGTPFEGSAKARWAAAALRYLALTNSVTLNDLQERSRTLISINEDFLKFLRGRDRSWAPVEIACFFEQYPMSVAGKNIGLIVPKDSATLPGIDPLSISANHVDLCRFEDEDRNGYISISNILSQWIRGLDARSAQDERNVRVTNPPKHSVHMGDCVFRGNIWNTGVVTGNIYTPVKDGIRLVGYRY